MCACSRENNPAPNLATLLQGTASTPAVVIDSSPSPGGRGHGRAPDPTRRPPRAPRIDAGPRHDLARGRRTRPGAALWAASSPAGAGKRRGRDHSSHQGPYGEAGRRRARAAARPATTTPLRTPHRGRHPERSPQTRGHTRREPALPDSRSGCRRRPVGVERRPSSGCTRRTPALSRAARGETAPQEGAPRMTPCTGATMVAASRRAGFQPTTTRAGDGITGPCPCCGGTDRVWIGSLPDGGPPWMAWSHGCSFEDMRSTLGRDASGHANGGGPGHNPVDSSTDEAGTPVFEVERRRAAGRRSKWTRRRRFQLAGYARA